MCPFRRTQENVKTDRGRDALETDARQVGAVIEDPVPDAGNAIRNGDARQVAAAPEGPIPDAGDGIRDCNARQAGAAIEGGIADASDDIWDRNARQAGAVTERGVPEAGDAIRNRDARQAGAALGNPRPAWGCVQLSSHSSSPCARQRPHLPRLNLPFPQSRRPCPKYDEPRGGRLITDETVIGAVIAEIKGPQNGRPFPL